MKLLAIDPGKHGGFAFGPTGSIPQLFNMPETPHDISEWFEVHRPERLFIEEVGGYIGGMGAPGSAMFNFGRNFGILLGVAAAFKVPTVLVRPQKWQKALGLGTSTGMSKTEWKNKLKAKAQQLYPSLKITLDTSDACLIWHAAAFRQIQ
jgi:hypothetical protein